MVNIPPIYGDLGMVYYCFNHITPKLSILNWIFHYDQLIRGTPL